jgi:ubiquinone/menaquinone biosynthesis C-methylase UbiE
MTDPNYEYSGLMARSWDLLRGDTSRWEDRFYFLDVIGKYGQPVLDVGCGTGRLLVDFLAQGIDIEGVDNSPEMLELCRQKAVALGLQARVYEQAMQSLDLPRRYQTVIVPSSSFQLLVEPGQPERAIRRFYEHLLPGGVLAMPFMHIWKGGDPLDTGWELSGEATRPENGVRVQRWSRTIYDPQTRLEHTEDRYVEEKDGQVLAEEYHQRSPATRDFTWEEVEQLYRETGFKEIIFQSQFTFEPVKPDDWIINVIGRR